MRVVSIYDVRVADVCYVKVSSLANLRVSAVINIWVGTDRDKRLDDLNDGIVDGLSDMRED